MILFARLTARISSNMGFKEMFLILIVNSYNLRDAQALQPLFRITPSEGALASGGQQGLELVFNADKTANADLILPGAPQMLSLTSRRTLFLACTWHVDAQEHGH